MYAIQQADVRWNKSTCLLKIIDLLFWISGFKQRIRERHNHVHNGSRNIDRESEISFPVIKR